MDCPRCATPLAAGATTCPTCSAPITPTEPTLRLDKGAPGAAASADTEVLTPGPLSASSAPVIEHGGMLGAEFPLSGPGSLASFGPRALARLLDLFLVGLVFTLITFVVLVPLLHLERIGQPGGPALGTAILTLLVLALVLGVLYGLYEVVLTGRSGATVGKKVFGMKVVSLATRTPLGFGASLTRFISTYVITLIAALIPVVGLIAPIVDELWALWDPRNQTLHDKVVSSVVVNTR